MMHMERYKLSPKPKGHDMMGEYVVYDMMGQYTEAGKVIVYGDMHVGFDGRPIFVPSDGRTLADHLSDHEAKLSAQMRGEGK